MKPSKLLFGAALLAIVLAVIAIGVLRSTWFSEYVRQNIVATLEKATGAHVSLDSYSFSWTRLTATFYGLTLRGSEKPTSAPLFHAARIRLSLRSRYLVAGRVRLAELAVYSPFIHLIVREDGSSNLPALQDSHVDLSDLVRLRIGVVAIRNGAVQINELRLPLDLFARDVDLLAQYHRLSRQYDVAVGLKHMALTVQGRVQSDASVALLGNLNTQRFSIRQLEVKLTKSSVTASGTLHNFAHPDLNLQVSGRIDATEVARAGDLPWLKGGSVMLQGLLHYDDTSGAAFHGNAQGENVTYDRKGVQVRNGNFTSQVFATPELIEVSQLKLRALNGIVNGDLRFVNLRSMAFRGSVSAIDVRSFVKLVVSKPLPFTASVAGPVTLDTQLGDVLRNTVITADVQVIPQPNQWSPAGRVALAYRQSSNALVFNSCDLAFPQSAVSLAGQLNSVMQVEANTRSLRDIQPLFAWVGMTLPKSLRLDGPQSEAKFKGQVVGTIDQPSVTGNVHVRNFRLEDHHWDAADADFAASSSQLQVMNASVKQAGSGIRLSGQITLRDWSVEEDSALAVQGTLNTADLAAVVHSFAHTSADLKGGGGSASLNLAGTLQNLNGTGGIALHNLRAYGETLDQFHAAVAFSGNKASITSARLRSGTAATTFRAEYEHRAGTWDSGMLHVRADTNGFALDTLSLVREHVHRLTARSELHAEGDFRVTHREVEPLSVNGTLALRDITVATVRRGDLTLNARTEGDLLTVGIAGNLEGSPVSGNLHAHFTGEDIGSGEMRFGKISLATALALVSPMSANRPGWDGSFGGQLTFRGPLRSWNLIDSKLVLDGVQVRTTGALPGGVAADNFVLTNQGPVIVEGKGSDITIRQLEMSTRDTRFAVTGSINLASGRVDLHSDGSVDARILQLVYPDLQIAGVAAVSLGITGVPEKPAYSGSIRVKNASLFAPDLTNGLSAINGTLRFDRNRAVLEDVTSETGGGTVRLTGVISFAPNEPLSYNVEAQASRVRFRYLRASVTGDASLRMTGTTKNGLLAGDLSLSRIVLEPGADLANALASAATPSATPINEQDFITGLGLDVHIQSSPDLQVLTSLSQDVQADIDLHLRGTREHPALLGHISANQGEVNVFGTRYALSRGNITFINPVRIDPVLDLDLQTETRGITVDVVITGTLNKLSMNYRSDPPLQAKDILALLTVGQTPTFAPEASNSRVQADTTALQAGASTVLGQAISPASNRLSKLFGITNVKIDPFVQNVYSSRQARLTLEQQISRNITVTYVTNLAQTSEQIFRFEWAFNPQYSVVAVRDDNGEFGVDIQYKKRFK